jgi:hypothetical protein
MRATELPLSDNLRKKMASISLPQAKVARCNGLIVDHAKHSHPRGIFQTALTINQLRLVI